CGHGHPGVDRPRSARARAAEPTHAGHDDLLGPVLHHGDARSGVVVAAADRDDRADLRRPVFDFGWPRPDHQPAAQDHHVTVASRDVLEVEDLRVYYHTRNGPVKAVDGVSF